MKDNKDKDVIIDSLKYQIVTQDAVIKAKDETIKVLSDIIKSGQKELISEAVNKSNY